VVFGCGGKAFCWRRSTGVGAVHALDSKAIPVVVVDTITLEEVLSRVGAVLIH
jgi:hypothetical protein